MSEQIVNVLIELKKQWGELYVVSQANTATLNSMQTELDAISKSANAWCNFALICACAGFVLAIACASWLIWEKTNNKEEK